MRAWPAALACALAACRPEAPPAPADASALDALARAAPDTAVSVAGVVADPGDGRTVLLDDGTGTIRVAMPEAVALRLGQRLMAVGRLRRDADGRIVLDAEEWLYDSTGTSDGSP